MEDSHKLRKNGVKAYLSRTKCEDVFERYIRKEIEKKYEVHQTSNDIKSIASVQVGLKKLDIIADIKFFSYQIDFDNKADELKFVLRNQQIEGSIVLHIEKQANFIVNLGDIHNKDYNINFLLLIKQLTIGVKIVPQASGIPQAIINVSLQDFDLVRDLNYHIENTDFLTDLVNLTKALWMGEVGIQITNTLLPQMNQQITKIANEKIAEFFKPTFAYEGEKKDVNVSVDLSVESFELNNNFAILVLNGFINNTVRPRKPYTILPQNHNLPDISKITGEDCVAVQVSDDVIHSAITAYFLNDINIETPMKEGGLKAVIVKHRPEDVPVIGILRDEDLYGCDLFITLETNFMITAKHSFLPDVGMGAKVRVKVSNIKIIEKPGVEDAVFLTIKISNVEVLEMYDYKMNPMSETMRKSKVTSTIREKAASTVIDKEIEIKKVKFGNSTFEAMSFIVYDDFITLVGKLNL